MITRRGMLIRMLRGYIENGLSDIGNFQDCMAYHVGDDGAEIEISVGGTDFTFYIAPGADGSAEGALGVMAVTDNGRDKVKGPIDPVTWARMSAFVRERIHEGKKCTG
jgi:hypothetical protein